MAFATSTSLFETEGTTFSEHVLTLRLMRTYQMLSDPGCIDMTITDIAFSSCFGYLSYFDCTFRRRFGATPADVRRVSGHSDVKALRASDEAKDHRADG